MTERRKQNGRRRRDGRLQILRKGEAAARVGYSEVHVMRLERAGMFPKKIRLGPASIGFLESEVDDWIRERAAERERA